MTNCPEGISRLDFEELRRLLAWWGAKQPPDYDEVYELIESIPALLNALEAVREWAKGFDAEQLCRVAHKGAIVRLAELDAILAEHGITRGDDD